MHPCSEDKPSNGTVEPVGNGDDDAVQSEIVVGKQLLHGLVPRDAAVLGTDLGHGQADVRDEPADAGLGGESNEYGDFN